MLNDDALPLLVGPFETSHADAPREESVDEALAEESEPSEADGEQIGRRSGSYPI